MSYAEDEGFYYDTDMLREEYEWRERQRESLVVHDSGYTYEEICTMLEDTFRGLMEK